MITSDLPGATECGAGFFCEQGARHIADGAPCAEGYFCPAGMTGYSDAVKCPVGTYSNLIGLQKPEQCLLCEAGYYCDALGMTQIDSSKICEKGHFCPPGSVNNTAQNCPPGFYCPNDQMSHPLPCQPGTFNSLPNQEACQPCTSGKFCNDFGLITEEGDCKEGYYCPIGSKTPTEVICPAGKQCSAGAQNYTSCDPGSYTLIPGQASCVVCPAGAYCDPNDVIIDENDFTKAITYKPCPVAYYCPEGTPDAASAIPCPIGTYSQASFLENPEIGRVFGLKTAIECTPCPPGQYCPTVATTNPQDCDDGYYCQSGART